MPRVLVVGLVISSLAAPLYAHPDRQERHAAMGENPYRWDGHWRIDGRYDWQSYRKANGAAFRAGGYAAPRGIRYRRYVAGLYLPPVFFIGGNYWLSDPWAYRLPAAPAAARWIRYFNDALLIDSRTGYVIDVVYGVFW